MLACAMGQGLIKVKAPLEAIPKRADRAPEIAVVVVLFIIVICVYIVHIYLQTKCT